LRLYKVLKALVKLVAPILVHTSEEVWGMIPGESEAESVHVALWGEVEEQYADDKLAARWERMIAVRDEVLKALEALRAAKTIGGSLEASVKLHTEDEELHEFINSFGDDLATIFIVSDAEVVAGRSDAATQSADIPALYIEATPSKYSKCARCWNFRPSVGAQSGRPDLCQRCVEVVDNL
jgi:isoleucyl-tRNA synthetase